MPAGALADGPDLLVAVPLDADDRGRLDLQGAGVLLDALAGEDLGAHHHTLHAGRHAERGVLHVPSLLAEDGAKQLLFRGELRLALRGDLADQDVARLDVGADADDARLVEVLQSLIANVGDVTGDLLLAELRVARSDLELLDVDGGEVVLLDQPLRDENRILEVVPPQGMKATVTFWPRAISPRSVAGPSAIT